MRSRLRTLALITSAFWIPIVSVSAETRITVDQLTGMVKSSIQMKHPDKQVALYLKTIQLKYRLEDRVIEELQGLGAGPKTVEALNRLRDESQELPKQPAAPPKPVIVSIPRPDSEEQAKVLSDVREYAMNYVKQLPDFICTQVVRRYYDPNGSDYWRTADTLNIKLTFFEQKEEYKVTMQNGRSTDLSYDRVQGATSSGEFGTLLREIFEPSSQATFEWDRWSTLRGRRVHVFTYRVPQSHSKWHVNYRREMDIVPGYSGEIFVDKEYLTVLRIKMQADDIPPSFPVQQAGLLLDYDYANINGKEFLLPMRSQMNMREAKIAVKNETEFRLYRKFGADSSIQFGADSTAQFDPLPDSKTQETPVK